MMHFENITFAYEPYPIGFLRPVFDKDVYEEMLAKWPEVEDYRHNMRKGQNKFYLNESKTKLHYHEFIEANPVWREFHRYIKSKEFLDSTMKCLLDHNVNLGYFQPKMPFRHRARAALGDIVKRKKLPNFPVGFYPRFEFSMLPADTGAVLPHTDDPKKVVTLVCYMPKEGEWKKEWGGGLEICWPKDPSKVYNFMNQKAKFEDVNVVRTYDYQPNFAILFVRAPNSWHSVHPMKGAGQSTYRRTITIVIETN